MYTPFSTFVGPLRQGCTTAIKSPNISSLRSLFGAFPHHILSEYEKLLQGFDNLCYAPHSRHTEIWQAVIDAATEFDLLSKSDKAGVYVIASRDRRHFYITGHSEYDPRTLKKECERDTEKELPIDPPENYFSGNNPNRSPLVRWRGHAHLLFSNCLNYYVYQRTAYDINRIPKNE